ncbi:MAG: CNNM domain-containing protein [Acidobacteriota bacterium]|nr:CNNM domain-containing protein [Acidobacteriota bacterium]
MSPEILLLLTVLFTIATSFFCSVLEAALLSVHIATVIDRKEQGHRGAELLLSMKRERIEEAISAILSLNTVTNTIGSTLAGAQAAALWDDFWVGLFTFLFVLGILIFSEIIPKTIGALYSVQLISFVGYTLRVLVIVMLPLVWLASHVTRFITRQDEVTITRGDISAMVTLAADEGAISSEQSHLFSNLLDSDEVSLNDVMTPVSVMAMMHWEATVKDLAGNEEVSFFSRIPLYDKDKDDIKGYIIVRQLVVSALRSGGGDRKLKEFMRPATVLPKSYSVGDALRGLIRKKEHMAIVLDEYGSLRGLVTLEDLIETLLGIEIIDESDRAVDMRDLAMKIREERLTRIEGKREH